MILHIEELRLSGKVGEEGGGRPMKSIALRVACAWFVFSACGGEADSGATTTPFTTTNVDGGEAPMDRCLGDAFADDFAVQSGDGETVSGHIEALASSTHGVVACGDGFLDIVGGGSVELGGTCSSIATDGDLAIVGLRGTGVVLVDLGGPSVLGTADVGDVRGVAIRGTQAWAAAGAAGVVALDASGGLTSSGAVGSIADARGVAIDDAGLWVAAGDAGVALIDPTSGTAIASADTESRALGVRTTDDGTIVLRGVFGWDIFEASGSSLAKSASHETTGAVFDAAVHDGEIVTAEVHAIVRHGDGAPRFEERPRFGDLDAPWLRSVASHDGELFVALGDEVAPVDIASASEAPDIMVDATTVYMWGDAGHRLESLVVVDNLGDAPLVIGSIDADAPFAALVQDGGEPIDGCPDAYEVEAGGSLLLAVSYTPDDTSLVTGEITLHTNDPDEPDLVLAVDGNRGEPEIGDEALDFELVTIDGDRFRLSDHLGKVVLVKMFNFGCKRCAEEFAEVESDVMPGYSAADFVAVGVNTTHRTAFAGTLAADADLTLPLALDIDSNAFRFYRMPEKVFPLNAIVGRDGRLTHVDAEEGLTAAQSAIDAAM
jgi:peroxiredoxin